MVDNRTIMIYFCQDVSLYPILRLILPDLERERGPHNLKQASLAKLYANVYGFMKNSDNYKKLANYRSVSRLCQNNLFIKYVESRKLKFKVKYVYKQVLI